jgi:hypothetical protein
MTLEARGKSSGNQCAFESDCPSIRISSNKFEARDEGRPFAAIIQGSPHAATRGWLRQIDDNTTSEFSGPALVPW